MQNFKKISIVAGICLAPFAFTDFAEAQDLPPEPHQIEAAIDAFEDIVRPLKETMASSANQEAMAQDYAKKAEDLRNQAMAGAVADVAINQMMTYGMAFLPPQAQLAVGILKSLGSMMGIAAPSMAEMAVNSFMSDLDEAGIVSQGKKGREILESRGFTAEGFASTLGYIFAGYWQINGGVSSPEFANDEDIPKSPTDVMISALENSYRSKGMAPPEKSSLSSQAQSLIPQAVRDVTPYKSRLEQVLSDMEN